MKKGYWIFMVLISLVLVSGQSCERNQNGGGGVFLGGKEGLVVEFIEDAPPLSGNFQNVDFPIELRLTNKGETDIGARSAQVYLTGFLYSGITDVTATKKQGENTNIISKVEEGENGKVEEYDIVSLGPGKYTATMASDSVPIDVSANICYPYETRVQVNDFCIPSTTRRTTGTQVCEVDSTKNLISDKDNSGGPIQITSLREDKGPDYVRVTLDINNVGNGDVVKMCKRDIQKEDMDEINVKMPAGFSCTFKNNVESNEGKVDLRSGHGLLRCKKTISSVDDAYKQPLVGITLTYHYRQEVSKTITINKA